MGCCGKFIYLHDLTKVYGNCQIHISPVYPNVDPVLHILFLNNCQVFLEIEFTQVGYFSTPLGRKAHFLPCKTIQELGIEMDCRSLTVIEL